MCFITSRYDTAGCAGITCRCWSYPPWHRFFTMAFLASYLNFKKGTSGKNVNDLPYFLSKLLLGMLLPVVPALADY